MKTIAYLWDMDTYWECRYCHRRWRKKEPMSCDNEQYLIDHIRGHQAPTRKLAAEVLHSEDGEERSEP